MVVCKAFCSMDHLCLMVHSLQLEQITFLGGRNPAAVLRSTMCYHVSPEAQVP